MGHAQKRLVSTAAKLVSSVHVSNIKAFPPKEALAGPSARSKTRSSLPSKPPNFFNAETWAALQPPTAAALSTFTHRIGLASTIPSSDIIQQACTHPSFIPLFERHNPKEPIPASNHNLAALGNSLLGLFATEYVNATFPHLPTRVLKAAISAYVGPTTCAHIATEMGAQSLLRWNRTVSVPKLSCLASLGLTAMTVQYAHTTSCLAYRRNGLHSSSPHCGCLPAAFLPVCTEICTQILHEQRGGFAQYDQIPGP